MRVILALFLFLLSSVANAQHPYPSDEPEPPTIEEIFSVKETFRYEVKYGFIRLGWVRVELLSDTTYEGKNHHHILTEITSNPRIPFVGDELDRFHSFFYINEDGLPVESYYWKDNIDEQEFKEIEYIFDRENGYVHYKEEDNTRDTLQIEEPATAGHVIFYFSRLFAGSNKDMRMPVYVTKKKGFIFAENSRETEERNYKPFDGPIQAYEMTGRTEKIEGPFGFSGRFRAWFLDDDLRVPLEARVKVLWGNVIVRIIEYSREDL